MSCKRCGKGGPQRAESGSWWARHYAHVCAECYATLCDVDELDSDELDAAAEILGDAMPKPDRCPHDCRNPDCYGDRRR